MPSDSRRSSKGGRPKKRSKIVHNRHHQENNDSDEEPEEEVNSLAWDIGDDKRISLSDWTIQIVSMKTGKTVNYNVHKVILARSQRKCEYFKTLFQSDNFQEAIDSTSRIELDGKAADAFHIFLNYIYLGELQIKTENAIALHYLGQYFGQKRLTWLARQFCKRDIKLKNIGIYYEDAKIYQNEKIMDESMLLCASYIDKVKVTNTIITKSDPKFWLYVQNIFNTNNDNEQDEEDIRGRLHLCLLITKFCSIYYRNLNINTFLQLTNEDNLKMINPNCAIELIALERKLKQKSNNNNNGNQGQDDDDDDDDNNNNNNTEPTELQKRCEDALYGNWGHISLPSASALHALDPFVLTRLLQSSHQEAKTCVRAMCQDCNDRVSASIWNNPEVDIESDNESSTAESAILIDSDNETNNNNMRAGA